MPKRSVGTSHHEIIRHLDMSADSTPIELTFHTVWNSKGQVRGGFLSPHLRNAVTICLDWESGNPAGVESVVVSVSRFLSVSWNALLRELY
jgi:hypothetical protein